jgi:hypothetical protein
MTEAAATIFLFNGLRENSTGALRDAAGLAAPQGERLST